MEDYMLKSTPITLSFLRRELMPNVIMSFGTITVRKPLWIYFPLDHAVCDVVVIEKIRRYSKKYTPLVIAARYLGAILLLLPFRYSSLIRKK